MCDKDNYQMEMRDEIFYVEGVGEKNSDFKILVFLLGTTDE